MAGSRADVLDIRARRPAALVERHHDLPDTARRHGFRALNHRRWDSGWAPTHRVLQYDLGYFDDERCLLKPIDNPFGPKVLPMCSE